MMDALSQGKTKVIALLKREQLRRRQMSRSSNSLPEEDTESLCESPRKMSAASPSTSTHLIGAVKRAIRRHQVSRAAIELEEVCNDAT